MNKIPIVFSIVLLLLSFAVIIPSSFAWSGQIAMDSDKRNIEYGQIINYKGYLYTEPLIGEELVYVTVSEQGTDGKIVWETTLIPGSKTVDYFENTAWTFDFIVDTSESNFVDDTMYTVNATYDDKSAKLDFFIKPDSLGEKAEDAGKSIIQAGEKTGEVIVDGGTEAGEVIVEKGTEAGEIIVETGEKTGDVIVETGEDIVEKGEIIGEVAVEKGSEGIEEINEKGGGCLIATAAYGTEMAPQIQFLREIRDNTLMSTSSGTSFMTGFNSFYYSFSPYVADYERDNPIFQEVVRAFITPMISTLSIMTLTESGSESEVLGLGISVIVLNIGMYVAAPTVIVFKTRKYMKSRKKSL